MRKIIFLLIISSVLISCRSNNNFRRKFSKRKYLKRFKSSKKIDKDVVNYYTTKPKEEDESIYEAKEINPEHFTLNEIEENDDSELILPQKQDVVPLKSNKTQSSPKSKNNSSLKEEKEVPAKIKLNLLTIITIIMIGLTIPTFGVSLVVGLFTGLNIPK